MFKKLFWKWKILEQIREVERQIRWIENLGGVNLAESYRAEIGEIKSLVEKKYFSSARSVCNEFYQEVMRHGDKDGPGFRKAMTGLLEVFNQIPS